MTIRASIPRNETSGVSLGLLLLLLLFITDIRGNRPLQAEYTLLYSTLDAYIPPVQGKSREYKPVEFNHPFGSHSRFDRIKRWKSGTVEPRFTDSRLTRTLC